MFLQREIHFYVDSLKNSGDWFYYFFPITPVEPYYYSSSDSYRFPPIPISRLLASIPKYIEVARCDCVRSVRTYIVGLTQFQTSK